MLNWYRSCWRRAVETGKHAVRRQQHRHQRLQHRIRSDRSEIPAPMSEAAETADVLTCRSKIGRRTRSELSSAYSFDMLHINYVSFRSRFSVSRGRWVVGRVNESDCNTHNEDGTLGAEDEAAPFSIIITSSMPPIRDPPNCSPAK